MAIDSPLLEWLKEFCRKVELPPVDLDADGACTLRFGDSLDVQFTLESQETAFALAVCLGRMPEQNRESFMLQLLVANFYGEGAGGSTLALAPDGESLFLWRQERIAGLDQEQWEALLGNLIQQAERWQRLLAAHDQSSGDAGRDFDAALRA